jgi:hypothetical protein
MRPENQDATARSQTEGGWPLPTASYDSVAGTRVRGVRQARRAANWTAAALLAGVAAATGYFAHHPAATAQTVGTGSTGANSATTVRGGHVAVTHPVVTSGGSGVTVGAGPGGTAGRTWSDN